MKESRSFYFVHILLPLFMSCTGWNRVRRALGECAPHFIQRGFFTQSNYALMNTTAFIVYGLSKFITSHVVKGNLFRMYTLLFGMVGVLCSLEGLASSSTTWKLLCFLRSLGSGLRVYGNVVADPMHCLQPVASR